MTRPAIARRREEYAISTPHPNGGTPPTIGEALQDVASAGKDLAIDRLELLKVEVTEALEKQVRRAISWAGAGFALFATWALLVGAAVAAIAGPLGLAAALALVAAPHLIAGVVLIVSARKVAS